MENIDVRELDIGPRSHKPVHYVGFWARLLAAMIDTIWMVIPIYAVLYWLEGDVIFDTAAPMTPRRILLEYLVPAGLVLVFWSKMAATPGKKLLKMKIVDQDTFEPIAGKRILIRYLGYYVSMLPLMLGMIWVGIDKRKQGWHDKLAGTVVIKE